jgi:FKBP-type peptidyl-prolyl cis-trans isomerase FkpA
MITTPTGLQYTDTVVGTGGEAKKGHHVHVHYTGWLFNDGVQGAKFDSSKDRGEPFAFSLGAGQVIPGWDQGFEGMKIGGSPRSLHADHPIHSRLRRTRRGRGDPTERDFEV